MTQVPCVLQCIPKSKGKENAPEEQQEGRREEQKPVPDVEGLVVLQPVHRELQGGVVLHATLQLHRGAPFGDLVLRHAVDPGGVCGEAPGARLCHPTPHSVTCMTSRLDGPRKWQK